MALFSLLGTTFGGDGQRTFKLPDFSKATNLPPGCCYYIVLYGLYPSRSQAVFRNGIFVPVSLMPPRYEGALVQNAVRANAQTSRDWSPATAWA